MSDSDERSSTHKLESDAWKRGSRQAVHYQEWLDSSKRNPIAQHGDGPLNKVVRPEEMPWEESPHGKIKHVMNERIADGFDVPAKGTDVYIQALDAGERSGKHRHMSEELVYVLEGKGYDHHWDPRIILDQGESGGTKEWEYPDEDDYQRFEWGEGDVIYIPTNTIHQHHASVDAPARLLCCQARVYNQLGFGYNDLEQLESAPGYDDK